MQRIRRTALVLASVLFAVAAAASPAGATPVEQSFQYVGGVQTWTVPAGVNEATFTLQGGSGSFSGNGSTPGGAGAVINATLDVTPGQTYEIVVGDWGSTTGPGGYNGGGDGGDNGLTPFAGGGGGATDVRLGTDGGFDARVLVAAGGGGAGGAGAGPTLGIGGAGGAAGTDGAAGADAAASTGGAGGTTLELGGERGTGAFPGTSGLPGNVGVGGAGATQLPPNFGAGGVGGGGGGGWTGGGGGATGASADATTDGAGGGGGGGGQSYVTPLARNVSASLAPTEERGAATITYEVLPSLVIGSQPTLSGVVEVGGALTCAPGNWSGAPVLGYSWLRNGAPITGATTTQYTLTAADVGQQVSCQVTATNAAGSTTARTLAVSALALAAPSNTVAPSVAGTAAIGRGLTCRPGTWAGSPTFSYTWLRNGRSISGATQATYKASKADAGQALQCALRATVDGQAASAQSLAVGGPPRLLALGSVFLVSQTGNVTVPVKCVGPTACPLPHATISSAGRVIARATRRTVHSGATSRIAFKLGSRGLRALHRRGSSITVRLVATPTGGAGINTRLKFIAPHGTH